MANSISVHVIHAADASLHLGFLTQILIEFKSENRIDDYSIIAHDSLTDMTFETLGEEDMVITLLTDGLIGLKQGIENRLIAAKEERPKYRMVEIIVDKIPYHRDFIPLPTSKEPIRDSADKTGVWMGIGMDLRELLIKRLQWQKYVPHAIGLLVIALGYWFWQSGGFNKKIEASFSHLVLDLKHTEPVPDLEECYIPCKVYLTNTSGREYDLKWSLKDTVIEGGNNPTHIFKKPGNYKMKLTASKGRKSGSVTKPLLVKSPPFASFEIKDNGCTATAEGCDVDFENKSENASKFAWSFVGVSPSSSTTEYPGKRRYMAPGEFKVRLEVENADGIKADTTQVVTIIRDRKAYAAFTATPKFPLNNTQLKYTFTSKSKNARRYRWEIEGDADIRTTRSFEYKFPRNGVYSVKLMIDGIVAGDSDDEFMNLRVYPNPRAININSSYLERVGTISELQNITIDN